MTALAVMATAGDTGTSDLLVISSPGFPSVMMLGSAGKALAQGPEAFSGNPALLTPGFTASGGRWNLQTTSVSLAGGFSGGESLDFAAGLTYLGKGGLLRRDDTGSVTGEYSYSTGTAMAGLSMEVLPSIRGGISLGISWENIDTQKGTGFTSSAGIAADLGRGFNTGLSLTGLGTAPSWSGIKKDMPTELHAAVSWDQSEYLTLFSGGKLGFSTADSWSGGICFSLSDLQLTGGYSFVPGEDETAGIFAGLRYIYSSSGIYIIEMAVAQRDEFSWPVLAGISVRF
jgi:hypothetical protein